jgi:excisionase family DNA binding protein
LNLKAASAYSGLSTKKLRTMVIEGELPYVKDEGETAPYKVDRLDLDAWIQRSKRTNVL